MLKLLCVYCSSSDRLDQKYYDAAHQTGVELVVRGWGLMYGGGKTGSMGTVARAVKSAGGRVVGVIPEFMKARELAFHEAEELISVTTMRERKQIMEERSDAFVALPGAWGTLEEIIEIMTLCQLGQLSKPIVFLNQDGFYDDLFRYFDRLVDEQFNKPSNRNIYQIARDVPEMFRMLEEWKRPVSEAKWFETKKQD